MGTSQSTPFSGCGADSDEEQKRIRPYDFPANNKWLALNNSYCTLYDGLVSLVQNNKYADLLIICGDDRFPVHRAIVCPRSKFFEEHCAPRQGEEDYASPAKPTKIWIDPSECDSQTLAAVLTFLYALDYHATGQQLLTFGLPEELVDEDNATSAEYDPIQGAKREAPCEDDVESLDTFTIEDPTPPGSSSRTSSHTEASADPGDIRNELVFHVQVCAAAHRFNIAALCDVAFEKLNKRMQSGPWKVEMVDCIRGVYSVGNGGMLAQLREAVVKSTRSRFRYLRTRQGWDDLIVDFPEFAVDMMKRL